MAAEEGIDGYVTGILREKSFFPVFAIPPFPTPDFLFSLRNHLTSSHYHRWPGAEAGMGQTTFGANSGSCDGTLTGLISPPDKDSASAELRLV